MKAQATNKTRGRTAPSGEKRFLRNRLSLCLLGSLLCAALFFSATGHVLAGPPGQESNSVGLWAVLSAQTREAVAQSQHFVKDLRLLYQMSQLETLPTESVASPDLPAEPECKLISVRERKVVFVKFEKSRS